MGAQQHGGVEMTTPKRVCLLTGSGGQLGRAFCEAYRSEYEIAAVYRSSRPWFPAQDARIVDPFDPTRHIDENDDPIFAIQADLLVPHSATRVVEATLNRFDRIDLIVNAAVSTVWAPMLGSDRLADSVTQQFALAVEVPLRIATAAARLSWQGRTDENRARNRNVVNVSSIAATRVYGGQGQSIYAASKAAMHQLTAHMALEFAPLGVRVNATAANNFPQIVSVHRAAAAIRALDQGSQTGTATVVDGAEDELTELGRAH
jgi:NAD(P)-dependent dehydrogenase (short-subunit alcohol dehydrogenase family)